MVERLDPIILISGCSDKHGESINKGPQSQLDEINVIYSVVMIKHYDQKQLMKERAYFALWI